VLSAEWNKGSKVLLNKFVEELPDRVRAVIGFAPFAAAVRTYGGVLEEMPRSDDTELYRKALHVVQVKSSGEPYIYAIRGRTKRIQVEELKQENTVIYIRMRKGKFVRKDPKIEVLAKYGPWTLDTIPYYPKKSEATVVARKAREKEVQSISDSRKRDRSKWAPELARLGVRVNRSKKAKPEKGSKAISDLGMLALRIEFGLDGRKATPHWRPAIRRLGGKRFGVVLSKHRRIKQTLTNPNFKAWKRWPPKLDRQVSMQALKRYQGFQTRVGR
jgi:hypothetical protein